MKDIILKHLNELGSTLEESYGNKLILLDEKDFTEFAETLVKKLTLTDVINCSTCKHNTVSKYIAPCYGCRDNDSFDNFESAIVL